MSLIYSWDLLGSLLDTRKAPMVIHNFLDLSFSKTGAYSSAAYFMCSFGCCCLEGRTCWFSIPLVALATYFAYVSRYTWTFAPGIWFFMLELIDGLGSDGKVYFTSRIRALSKLLIFSLAAGVVLVGVGVFFKSNWIVGAYDLISGSNISPQYVLEKIQQQQLLWYRLFPNETYGNGILIGLVVAISPLAVVLLYLLS